MQYRTLGRTGVQVSTLVLGAMNFGSLGRTTQDDVTAMVSACIAAFGRIDVLHNNVGIVDVGGPVETTDEIWDLVNDVNLKSMFLTCKHVLPHMERQGKGAIVNIAAKAALDAPAASAAYAASKAAAITMMNSMAADLKGTGVRVNSVLPSIIDTEPNRKAMPKADFSKWSKPSDIARVILFLCSDDAKLVHGASIPV